MNLKENKRQSIGNKSRSQFLCQIPQVEALLRTPLLQNLVVNHPRRMILDSIRTYLGKIRQLPEEELSKVDFSLESFAKVVKNSVLEKAKPSLRPVINATGVILHTGLGRALLAEEAETAISGFTRSYCNLETDLLTGKRKDRSIHIESLLCALTNAEAGFVVNNNAAAVLLALNTFAKGCEVIVSRGQLVEIGGSFRMPEVMQASGVKLIEVGTTNRTYLEDYENAITKQTALLLYVHPSNFKMLGFTQEVEIAELVKLTKKKRLLAVVDLGSGALIDLTNYGLTGELTAQATVATGADIVTFSADKLLGGPQAGVIVGKKKYIEKMKKNPLSRALRVDKLCLAGLEVTLRLYLDEKMAVKQIPVLEMLLRPLRQLEIEAEALKKELYFLSQEGDISLKDGFSQLGGGALPAVDIPTKLVSFRPKSSGPQEVVLRLRLNNPPVFTRIFRDEILLDPRTLKEEDFPVISEAFKRIFFKS